MENTRLPGINFKSVRRTRTNPAEISNLTFTTTPDDPAMRYAFLRGAYILAKVNPKFTKSRGDDADFITLARG